MTAGGTADFEAEQWNPTGSWTYMERISMALGEQSIAPLSMRSLARSESFFSSPVTSVKVDRRFDAASFVPQFTTGSLSLAMRAISQQCAALMVVTAAEEAFISFFDVKIANADGFLTVVR